jgi:hypothetical protein
MLIEESRIFQVVIFRTLHLHLGELDRRRLLQDVMVIADEADAQLREAVRSLTAKGTHPAVAPALDCKECRGFQSSLSENGAVEACRTGQKPKLLQWSLTLYSVCSADLAFQRCTG